MEPISALLGTLGLVKAWIAAHSALLTSICLAGGVLVVSWAYVMHQFAVAIIPFIERLFGKRIASALAELVCTLDRAVVFGKNSVKRAWQMFTQRCLQWRTRFRKSGPSTITATSEAYFLKPDDVTVMKLVTEEELSWDDVPDDVRHALIQRNKAKPVVDSKDVAGRVVMAAAAEHGFMLNE